MKGLVYLCGAAGLGLATTLIAYHGIFDVYEALRSAGWGLLVVALYHLLPMALDTLAWQRLLQGSRPPRFGVLLTIRWIREAVDGLLPVAQVGGELVGTRLLMFRGVSGARAGASVVLDLTLAVVSQLLFTLGGLALLWMVMPHSGLAVAVIAGLASGTLGIGAFITVQRFGLFELLVNRLAGMAGGRRWLTLVGGAGRLDEAVARLYGKRRALLQCGLWQSAAWLAGAGEIWLALYYLGHPPTLAEALLLESLGQAVRSAGFAIPGALGIQEGGYMLLVGVLGLSPETGLVLSLTRRARELLLGVPALITWQLLEGRRVWKRRLRRVDPALLRVE